ncbi:MAG: Gfo/Idh/MocA family oxidoreductase [Gemmatimonadetes bacterium]|nr:Gfo/Idh/MocA family oxidoreductase [Gemmatimonadota bacterium]
MTARPRSAPGILFIGSGYATRLHSKVLARRFPAVRLGYFSRSAGEAAELAHTFGGRAFAGSWDEALRDDEFDTAFVTTPPDTHCHLALQALAFGKHVIVEKPAFLTGGEFDEVERAASEASRMVLVAENYFYKPLRRRLRDVIESGVLGQVRIIEINAVKRQPVEGWRADPARAGGGALFEGGIHWVSLMANLGLEIRKTYAATSPTPPRSTSAAWCSSLNTVRALWAFSPIRGRSRAHSGASGSRGSGGRVARSSSSPTASSCYAVGPGHASGLRVSPTSPGTARCSETSSGPSRRTHHQSSRSQTPDVTWSSSGRRMPAPPEIIFAWEDRLNLITEILVGLAVGGHIATWGMFKDSIHEGFTVAKYLRSILVGVMLAPLAAAVTGIDSTTASGIVLLFGLTYALERAVTKFWKTFVRDEDQSKYFIPMQLHVMGLVVQNRGTRLAVGLGLVTGLGSRCSRAPWRFSRSQVSPRRSGA